MSHGLIKALLVEDEEIAEAHATKLLGSLRCYVDTAKTGHDALGKAKENKYDIIFMDLGLFDIDGFNVVKLLRSSLSNSAKETPIIALTAYPQCSVRKKAFTLGFSDFLLKPLTIESCQEILEKFARKL